jgi:RNA polymerase sigma-70 factor (ECF subfamily)
MAAPQSTDEAQMIAYILAGDRERYHDLIRPYEQRVFMMALSFMKNEADAEDVAQETFIKAFRKLSEFRSESKFSTWLISIALNEARSRLRRKKTMPMESFDALQDERGGVSPALLRDWREVPLEALERKEVRNMLQEAIAALPDIYREVFLLRDVEELSVNETAGTLNITDGTVKVRLHRARLMLQKQLAPRLKQEGPKKRWLPWL